MHWSWFLFLLHWFLSDDLVFGFLFGRGSRGGEGLVPHGLEVSLQVGHAEEGQEGEGDQIQQGGLRCLEHLKQSRHLPSRIGIKAYKSLL